MKQRWKLLTILKALNKRNRIDIIYMIRKEGRRGHGTRENYVDIAIQGLEEFMNKSKEGRAAKASNSNNNRATKVKIILVTKTGRKTVILIL